MKSTSESEIGTIDEQYFSSYAHLGIHQTMLKDIARTATYRDAILLAADEF
ncbi:MAG: hypothetical protein EZS28_024244, partial [Streblomastix strix]